MIMRRVTATLIFGLVFCLPLAARPQQSPLTRAQVINLVKNQFGDEAGARSIEKRGIDFEPSPDFLESLKDAGASDAFIQAVQKASHAGHPARPTLNQIQVLGLLGGQVPSHRVAMLVAERGIDFDPQPDFLDQVRRSGGEQDLIDALRTAKVVKPLHVDPGAAAREAQVRQHVARAIELEQKGQFPDAENEIRAAMQLWPNNSTLLVDLASVLQYEERWSDSIPVLREAIKADPTNVSAHTALGSALGSTHDLDGAMAEFHEALRVDPNDDNAHYNLGVSLMMKNNPDGAIAQYREALRLNPKNAAAHSALGKRLRLDKHDLQGALGEFRAAYTLEPGNAAYKSNYEDLAQELNH